MWSPAIILENEDYKRNLDGWAGMLQDKTIQRMCSQWIETHTGVSGLG